MMHLVAELLQCRHFKTMSARPPHNHVCQATGHDMGAFGITKRCWCCRQGAGHCGTQASKLYKVDLAAGPVLGQQAGQW